MLRAVPRRAAVLVPIALLAGTLSTRIEAQVATPILARPSFEQLAGPRERGQTFRVHEAIATRIDADATRRPYVRNALIGFVVGAVVVGTVASVMTDANCDAVRPMCRDNVIEARVIGGLVGGVSGAAVGMLVARLRGPARARPST